MRSCLAALREVVFETMHYAVFRRMLNKGDKWEALVAAGQQPVGAEVT